MLKAKEIIYEAYNSDVCILNNQNPLVELAAQICVIHETKLELLKQGIEFSSMPKFIPMVIADSGVGKTYILENIIGKHFETALIDCSRITPPGYKGYNLENAIGDIFAKTKNDNLIIILDEIDKLVEQPYPTKSPTTSSQPSFLKLMEGSTFKTYDTEINLEKVSFVLCGAFSKIKENKEKEKKAQVGFVAVQSNNDVPTEKSLRQEIIRYGIMPEIANRASNIIYIPTFSKEDYKSLLESDNQTSALNKQKAPFAMHGAELEISKSASEKIIDEATRSGRAGRAVDGIIQKYTSEAFLKVSNSNRINQVLIGVEDDELVVKYSYGKRTTDLYLNKKNFDKYYTYNLKSIYKCKDKLLDFCSYLVCKIPKNEDLNPYKEALKYYYFFLLYAADGIAPSLSFEYIMDIEENIRFLKNIKEDLLPLIKSDLKIDDEKYFNKLESKYNIVLSALTEHSTVSTCKEFINSTVYDFNPKEFRELQVIQNAILSEKQNSNLETNQFYKNCIF